MERGYVKLWRKISDNQIIQDGNLLQVFIWCLIHAAHKKKTIPVKTGRGNTFITLEKGQLIVGRNSLAKELNMAPSTTRNTIEKLKFFGILDTQPDTHWTVVSIRNWSEYQELEFDLGQASGHPLDRQRTGKGQAKDTTKEVKEVKEVKELKTKDSKSHSRTKKSVRDPRLDHPAIKILRKLLERYPPKAIWDDCIDQLTETFDPEKVTECFQAWVRKGYNPHNLTWIEWYLDGRNGDKAQMDFSELTKQVYDPLRGWYTPEEDENAADIDF